MKATTLILSASLLTSSTLFGSTFSLDFFTLQRGGFHGFADGVYWGIVINTGNNTNEEAFSVIENLDVGLFQGEGINKSNQWLNDDLLYLTQVGGNIATERNAIIEMPPPKSHEGALGSIFGQALAGTRPGEDNAPYDLSGASFGLIWFDIKEPATEGPIVPDSKKDEYNFLVLPGFTIPSGSATANLWELFSDAIDTSTRAIPEPSTYALMLAGVALAGVAVCRRRSKAARA